MNGLSRFGHKRLRRLVAHALPDDDPLLRSIDGLDVPTADKGQGLERNDQLVSGDFRSRFEHLSRYLAASTGDWRDVADIGCGTGYGVCLLSTRGVALGMDVSQAAVKYARSRYSKCDFVLGDACAVPLADGCVDAVTAYEVIEHLPQPEMLLEECHRLLRKGGTLYLSSPNPRHAGNCLRKILFRIPVPAKVDLNNVYHLREFAYDDMISLASSTGYQLIWSSGQTLPVDQVLPRIAYVFRRALGSGSLGDFYDWMLSEMGRRFPSLSWTVIYALKRL